MSVKGADFCLMRYLLSGGMVLGQIGYLLAQCTLNMNGTQLVNISDPNGCNCGTFTFYDNGGPSGNYTNNRRDTLYLVNPGGRIQLSFSSIATESCCDYVWLYDGRGPNAPLVGRYSGTVTPPTWTSSTDTVTVIFYSDGSNTYAGYAATAQCVGGLLRYDLSGGAPTLSLSDCMQPYTFLDGGGTSGAYPEGIDHTVTFQPVANTHLIVAFPYQLTLGTGDTLWVHAGSTTNAPLLAAFVRGSSRGDTIVSPVPGGSLTFRFKSNTDGNTGAGWSARIFCAATPPPAVTYMGAGIRAIPCSGGLAYRFYDSGSPGLMDAGRTNYGNYGNNEDRIITFVSLDEAERIRLQFSSFHTEGYFSDFIEVYDGPSVNAPYIGRWGGSSLPPTLTSSGAYLTIRFRSDGTTNYPGWIASVTCTGESVPPTVNLSSPRAFYTLASCTQRYLFTDMGGPTSNYPENRSDTISFFPPSGSRLAAAFSYQLRLASGDTLWAFAGTTCHSDSLLAVFTPGISDGDTLIGLADEALSFVFRSNLDGQTAAGWQAVIFCASPGAISTTYMGAGIRVVLCETGYQFYDSGRPYITPGGTYSHNENRSLLFIAPSGCGVNVQFQNFNTEACCDSLVLYSGAQPDPTRRIGGYRGTNLPGGGSPISAGSDTMLAVFRSDGTVVDAGWSARLTCTTQLSVSLSPSGSIARCHGDSVTFTVSPGGTGYTYTWNTGYSTSMPTYTVYQSGTYYVTVTTPSGCSAMSAPVEVVIHPPLDTAVQVSGSGVGSTTLTGSGCSGNNIVCSWVNCATGQVVHTGSPFTPTQSGSYALVVRNTSTGCADTSSCYLVDQSTGVSDGQAAVSVYPNPTSGGVSFLSGHQRVEHVRVWDLAGRLVRVYSQPTLPLRLEAPQAGVFVIEVVGPNGEKEHIRWQVLP